MDNKIGSASVVTTENKGVSDDESSEKSSVADMPEGWFPMSEEFRLTEEDEKSGLKDFLYEARDIAARDVGDFFSSLGIDEKSFKFLYNIPIGLEKESERTGYDPGCYGIVMGRDSNELEDFLNDNEENRTKRLNRMSATLAHEMIHAYQTIALGEVFDTIGLYIMNSTGIEESFAEAIADVAVLEKRKGLTIEETAKDLEDACARQDMPATQMAARMMYKMKPDKLKWYLTCGQIKGAKSNNEIKKMFGEYYNAFCKGMNKLYDHEVYNNLIDFDKKSTVIATRSLIDSATA